MITRKDGRIAIYSTGNNWHAICGHCPHFPALCYQWGKGIMGCPKEWAHVAALANEHYKEKHRG